MKAKIVTSLFSGLLLPWFYFLFVTVSPMVVYVDGVAVKPVNQVSGIVLFIDHNGVLGSVFIYGQVATLIAFLVFLICSFNNWLAARI